jgi:phosphosulfolactate phosphohydrolase-like enzyme
MAEGQILVTSEHLRTVSNSITSALENAQAIAQQYLAEHENIMNAAWGGGGATASMGTAGQIEHDIQQANQAGMRLSNGLINAANLMDQHEEDAAHTFNGFGGGPS